jgi:hypothetical protein
MVYGKFSTLKLEATMTYKRSVIGNLRAGKGAAEFNPILSDIHLMGYGEYLSYYLPDSFTKLSEVLEKMILEDHVKVIYVYGGDGTIHKVIDILIYKLLNKEIPEIPLILPLGGGTQKAIFQWLGWGLGRTKPIDIFRKAMETDFERLPRRKLRPLAITFFNTRKNRVETHYCFIFTIGAVNRVIEVYDRGHKSVLSGIGHTALGAFASVARWPKSHANLLYQMDAIVKVNGERLPRQDTLTVLCSVTESTLFGVEPFRGTAESNQFYTAAYAVPAAVVATMLPVLVRASFLPPGDRFFNEPVFNMEITPKTETSFFADGDFFYCKPGEPIRLELGPEIELVSRF